MELDVAKLPKELKIADAMAQAIEVIRNRIDQYGVAEPLIARQGARWIVVQLPGITDSGKAKALIGKTAMLEFRMVDDSEKANNALNKIAEKGWPFRDTEGEVTVSTWVASMIPEGMILRRGKDRSLYLLKGGDAPLTGADLEDARVETGGDYGMPIVGFTFKDHAGDKFSRLTGTNVGKNMAIVLDDIVFSAPVIRSRISGGSGIIEGQFTPEDARNLAIVLRAGALPAPLNIIEERTVGPTLGEDSIRAITATSGRFSSADIWAPASPIRPSPMCTS